MRVEKDSTGCIGLYDMTEREAELLQMAVLAKVEVTDRSGLAAIYRRIAMTIDRALPNSQLHSPCDLSERPNYEIIDDIQPIN